MKITLMACLGMICISPLLAAPIFGNSNPEQTGNHPTSREQMLISERSAFANRQIHVLYRPFILAYSHASIIPRPPLSAFNTKPLAFTSEAQFRDFQQLLHPQDGSDRPEESRAKVGRFGEVCLMVEITDSRYRLLVDEKGAVRIGDRYYHLNTTTLLKMDHLLNDLWYAQNPSCHKYVAREQLDLTPEKLEK